MNPRAWEAWIGIVRLWLLLACSMSYCSVKTQLSDDCGFGNVRCLSSSNYTLFFHTESKTWIEAFKYCEGKNSSLVHGNDKEVRNSVKELLNKDNYQGTAWIGLERSIFGCGPWHWVSGKEVSNEVKVLRSNQDDTSRNNNCGAITWNSTSKLELVESCCWTKFRFICQSFICCCAQ